MLPLPISDLILALEKLPTKDEEMFLAISVWEELFQTSQQLASCGK